MTSLLALWSGLLLIADDPVKNLAIHPADRGTEITIAVEGNPDYRDFLMEGPHRLVVDFLGARHELPGRDFSGIDRGGVRAVRTSQYSSEIVRIVVELEEKLDYRIERTDGGVRLVLNSPPQSFEPWSSAGAGGASSSFASSPGSDTDGRAGSPSPRRNGTDSRAASANGDRDGPRNLMGPGSGDGLLIQQQAERITVSFTNTPLQDVLFTFAEFSGRSIVPGSQVGGNVTADIRDQPWDVALREILEARGLVARETEAGIIRVDNVQNLAEQEEFEPVVTRPYRINFETASEIQSAIEPLLSERGSISVSSGTNTLIVTDLPRIVDEVEQLLEDLDVRTPQVQISAKIIFVNRTDLNEFGVLYDLKDTRGNQLNQVNPGGIDEDGDGVIGPEEQTRVGEDVIALGGSSIAALGNANQTVSSPALLALSSLVMGRHTLITFVQALEELNMSDIQAAPTLTVLDNNTARVQVGQETPLRVVEAGGQPGEGVIPQATVQFRETGVILEVTPHITANENILLELHAERSDAELAASDVGFVFNTQEADSRVLVDDGETAVMAGLTVTEESEVRAGIPVLMDLPVVGRLFRLTRNEVQQQDLMILVTPHIVRNEAN